MSRGTVNKIILIGRLGKAPEMQYTPSGVAVASFSVATNYRQKNQEGEWEDKTEWTRVKTFGKTAEIAGEYLDKGGLVYIDGSLRTRSWEDQNGQKKYMTEVVCNEMQLLGGKGDSSSAGKQDDAQSQKSSPEAQQPEEPDTQEPEDDLPF